MRIKHRSYVILDFLTSTSLCFANESDQRSYSRLRGHVQYLAQGRALTFRLKKAFFFDGPWDGGHAATER